MSYLSSAVQCKTYHTKKKSNGLWCGNFPLASLQRYSSSSGRTDSALACRLSGFRTLNERLAQNNRNPGVLLQSSRACRRGWIGFADDTLLRTLEVERENATSDESMAPDPCSFQVLRLWGTEQASYTCTLLECNFIKLWGSHFPLLLVLPDWLGP